jgi:hypothetical protein
MIENTPPKRVSFLIFIATFAYDCYDFHCLWFRNTMISEKSDMTKSIYTFCSLRPYKDY